MDREISRLKSLEAASGAKLAQRFNLRPVGDPAPLGPVKPRDLPKDLLDQAKAMLEMNYAVNGFASREEAVAAFERMDSIQVFTQIGLTFATRGGDPSNRVPGNFVIEIIGWFAGTPPP